VRPLSRRDVLRAGGLAALGVALAACSKKKPKASGNPKSLSAIIAGRSQNISLISTNDEILSRPGTAERFAFALFLPNSAADRYTGGTARIWIAQDQASNALGPFDAAWHDQGLGDKGVYVTRIPFPADGQWLAFVEGHPTGKIVGGAPSAASIVAIGGTTIGVGRRFKQPIPGEKAISVATPTFTASRGVKPICTRKPACSMHDLSLDAALRNGKPTVMIIGTPQFCQSRTCGPMVDIIDGVKKTSGAGVNFIHVEVFKDDTNAPAKGIESPAAQAWKLESEPATYFIAPDGTIADRVIGAAGRDEIAAAVQALRG
jgi:hypothetical protein